MKNPAKRYPKYFFAWLVLPLTIVLLAGCSSTPKMAPTPVPIARPALPPVVNYALSLQGKPYRYGKASPEEGFDCSGFVKHVYGRHGVYLPRTAREMASALPPVGTDNLNPGDLVFFNTNGGRYSHVGLLVKDDEFIHAPSRRTGKVLVSSLNNRYWRRHFTGARRPKAHAHASRLKIGLNNPGLSDD